MTKHRNGKFYVGRHSTNNLEDGYLGSGKWIRSIKDKENLEKHIISFFNNENELRLAEEKLIKQVINDPDNMNFNDSSCGFASGKRNPSNNPYVISRRKNWMQTPEGKKWASKNNPSKMKAVKKQRSDFARQQLENGTHNFQVHYEKRIENQKIRLKFDNPMFKEDVRKAHSERLKKQYQEAKHNFQKYEENPTKKIKRMKENNPMFNPDVAAKLKKPKPKVCCPHCGKVGGKPAMVRYHFDNCKHQSLV